MDMSICLSSIYTISHQDEDGKDFRFYFDFEHLKESSVLDQAQFWSNWRKWHRKDGLSLHLVEDFRITPMKLYALIMRKFVFTISSRLNWDFDSIHIVRGDKARNKELWPNLEVDTLPESLLSTLQDKIVDGRNSYTSTDEPDTSFFDPLKDKYSTHFLDEYKDLWDENSEWHTETTKLNVGCPVEFDGYMGISVDTKVLLRGKKQIETFNGLTGDCKDGINTCSSAC
ncbi:hypothetical protein LOK49_LG07G02779 [Camellia lanceoleosa]|uniref:Uncharacterized protein n=1 Tax=Camellia lanceoleosa TaxID=1840588 RepID=A0ACC0H6B5_9ERIC|nr:hypothetical protein LOK49_LG07G02779 [Camellia lanceoleosa]